MACCKKEDKGQCGVIGRSFFYICGFIGLAFSLLVIFSCRFLSYSTIPGTVPSTLPPPFTLSEQANVGLFRWDSTDEQLEDTGCVYYTNNEIDNFDSAFRTAQIVGYVSVICVAIALLLSTIEFVCCRFCCSKFFLSFFMICAMVTQSLTFAIWTTDSMCTAGRTCEMRIGSFFSIIAACFYFVASVIVCTTPKPTPWIKRIKAEDDDTGCLVCCTKKQQAKEQDPEEMPEKSVPRTDSLADSPDEIAAAVAAGAAAAAAAGTAVVIAADDEEEEDKDNVGGEEDPEAALAASTGDEDQVDETPAPEEDDSPATEGDEEAGDVKGDESAVLSVAPSEASQAGEEITFELSQTMVKKGD
jgi:hypothetical protein